MCVGGHEFQERYNCKKSRVGGPGLCELAKRNPSLGERDPRETEAAWGGGSKAGGQERQRRRENSR